mmetsp:Transcript_22203/g.70965  ORF Transcript_22203/g.70965 Transcript_22203/m.70965 type:complete len:203 (+) Transcript_22203:1572-2180(+)
MSCCSATEVAVARSWSEWMSSRPKKERSCRHCGGSTSGMQATASRYVASRRATSLSLREPAERRSRFTASGCSGSAGASGASASPRFSAPTAASQAPMMERRRAACASSCPERRLYERRRRSAQTPRSWYSASLPSARRRSTVSIATVGECTAICPTMSTTTSPFSSSLGSRTSRPVDLRQKSFSATKRSRSFIAAVDSSLS